MVFAVSEVPQLFISSSLYVYVYISLYINHVNNNKTDKHHNPWLFNTDSLGWNPEILVLDCTWHATPVCSDWHVKLSNRIYFICMCCLRTDLSKIDDTNIISKACSCGDGERIHSSVGGFIKASLQTLIFCEIQHIDLCSRPCKEKPMSRD